MVKLYIYDRGSKALGLGKCLIHTARFLHRHEALEAKREFYYNYRLNSYDKSSSHLCFSIKEDND